MIETIAFAFSIMAVIGGVSSTLSFGLLSGKQRFVGTNDKRPLTVRCIRRPCWDGLGLVYPVHLHHVHRRVDGRACLFYAVSRRLFAADLDWLTPDVSRKNERGFVLLLCQTGSRAARCARELDHRLGERHGPGDSRVLDRLHCVRLRLGLARLLTAQRRCRAQMITTAVAVATNGDTALGPGPTYGILIAILLMHGIICSSATRILARLNLFYGVITSTCTRNVSHLVIFINLSSGYYDRSNHLTARLFR